ncbi:MAG: hypothetical protein RLZZ488_1096 [Pseudomonadota bacterium]
MSVWSAASTLVLFSPPTPQVQKQQPPAPPTVGAQQVLSTAEFSSVWRALFASEAESSDCGAAKDLRKSDEAWIAQDAFLVQLRGFRSSICKAQAWYVASMRLDPCRMRLNRENKSSADIHSCSQNGKFSEVRFVLQPVEKTDHGYIFPDAALHVAFTVTDLKKIMKAWRSQTPEQLIKLVRDNGKFNDISLFIGGGGLERWSFARIAHTDGIWKRDRLAHGGYYESLSDAELNSVAVKTQRPKSEKEFSPAEFLNPLKVHPLQGSCIGCHVAEQGRPARLFRMFGWGLAGEPVVSARLRAEAEFAAKELQILEK